MTSETTATDSTGINKLVEALAKAKLAFDPALKDATNPAFRSKYADMASLIRATEESLSKNGLVVMQFPISLVDQQQAGVRTILAHSSGQSITSEYMMPAVVREAFTPQTMGMALTYSRRYAYQAILGIAGEDDDGNSASGQGTKEAAQTVAQRKIAEAKAKAGQEGITLVPWKGNTLSLAGNGVTIVKAEMSAEQKAQFAFKYDNDAKGYVLPAAQGHAFASMAEKFGVKVDWSETQVQPEAD